MVGPPLAAASVRCATPPTHEGGDNYPANRSCPSAQRTSLWWGPAHAGAPRLGVVGGAGLDELSPWCPSIGGLGRAGSPHVAAALREECAAAEEHCWLLSWRKHIAAPGGRPRPFGRGGARVRSQLSGRGMVSGREGGPRTDIQQSFPPRPTPSCTT